MEMVNDKMQLLRAKLDKYPAAQDAEVGHCCVFRCVSAVSVGKDLHVTAGFLRHFVEKLRDRTCSPVRPKRR